MQRNSIFKVTLCSVKISKIQQSSQTNFIKKCVSTSAVLNCPKPVMPTGPVAKSFTQTPKLTYEELLNMKKDKINRSLQPYYKKPLVVSSASMQWIFDLDKKRYLDFFGGIVTVSVGHCHPRLVKVLKDQAQTLWHTTAIYTHPQIITYAEKLASKFPDPLSVVYFVNSGSEANDMAILLARLASGNSDLLALRNGYHGMSLGTMGLTAVPKWNYNVPNRHNIVHLGMRVDPYQGPYGGQNCRDSISQVLGRPCDCGQGQCKASELYVQEFQDTVSYMTSGKIAGFIAESIHGVGGAVQLPKGFVKGAFELTRKHGGVCISDEVQTGFGRLGTHFWGFESHDVVPDIVVMAKGIGNGVPLAAVVTTPTIASNLTRALYFNTYGGNPLCCAVGEEVLNVIEDENLQQNADYLGTKLLLGLIELRDEFEIVGDVRGKGLMVGVEMVEEKESRKPLNSEKFLKIFEEIKDLGLLLGKGGPNGSVYRLKPPMCITDADVDFALDVMRHVLTNNS